MLSLKLFCNASLRFGLYVGKAEAVKELGPDARYPDPDELRHYWMAERLYELSTDQIQKKLGVTRQAVSQWRKKAGADLPVRTDYHKGLRADKIRGALDATKSANEIAGELHVSAKEVREIARQQGIKLPVKNKKKPSDEEIIELARGRTWRELARLCNVSMYTLRNYVYGKPELRGKVCGNLTRELSGGGSHGKVDADELVTLYREGWTVFKLAAHFQTQPMNIIYWLKKLEIYKVGDAQTEAAT